MHACVDGVGTMAQSTPPREESCLLQILVEGILSESSTAFCATTITRLSGPQLVKKASRISFDLSLDGECIDKRCEHRPCNAANSKSFDPIHASSLDINRPTPQTIPIVTETRHSQPKHPNPPPTLTNSPKPHPAAPSS
jgi:hypothetical protein